MADFRETYLLNTWEMGLDGEEEVPWVVRAAALAWQLPPGGRVKRALMPAAGNDDALLILRRIELNQRSYAWSRAGGKGKEPEPLPLRGERELAEAERHKEESKAPSVAARLGLI